MRTGTTRGLAAALQTWDDAALARLLRLRPDLARPVPVGATGLAARACSEASLRPATLDLTRADLAAAQRISQGLPAADEPEARLRERAIVWDEEHPVVAGWIAGLVEKADLDDVPLTPPPTRPVATCDAAAGQTAALAVMLVDEALRQVDATSPRVLRTGGMPAADVRALGRALGADGTTTALLLEICSAAGLLAEHGDDDPVWAPTTEYDEWLTAPAAQRWALLARTWLTMRQAPHLVGTPNPHRKGTTNSLAAEVVWTPMRTIRRHVLDELATLDGGCSASDLTARLQWRHPTLRVADHEAVTATVLAEASWLGVVAGGLTLAGRALRGDADPAAAMAPHLPEPAAGILLGADLTAVAAGLVEGDLADLLHAAATPESRGGATVFRFSAASVARALDAGWTSDLLRERISAAAGGLLPQPLDYLLADAARRHGALTLGGVSSYLRCDDPAVLAELAATPRLALRVVAPTVAVSNLAPTALLARLRVAGRVPAVEGPDGEVHVVGAAPVRARAPRPSPPAAAPDLAAVVAAVRAGTRPLDPEATDPEVMRAVLVDAAQAGATVRVDYVGAGGQPVVVDLAPAAVDGGRVIGHVDGAERVVPLARVVRVRS